MTDVPPIDPEAPIHKFRERRQRKGRDFKVLITSRNSTTGTGKTTLACWLALNWDDGWHPDDQATLHVREYLERYRELSPGSVLLMDEAEQVDARRSMSQKNVDFAEKWMMMRVRQVDSILTLPTASALDKRLKELADVRINVLRRGLARVYRIVVDDHSQEVQEWFMHELEWPDISNRPEMERLDEMKQNKIEGEIFEADDGGEEAVADGGIDQRDEAIRSLYEKSDLTQGEIAESYDLTQTRVNQIINE